MPLVHDESLRLVWIDNVTLSARGDVPLATLICSQVIGGKQYEVLRLQTTIDHLGKMGQIFSAVAQQYAEQVGKVAKAIEAAANKKPTGSRVPAS